MVRSLRSLTGAPPTSDDQLGAGGSQEAPVSGAAQSAAQSLG